MPRRHGQRKKGNSKTKGAAVPTTSKPTLVENKQVLGEKPIAKVVVAEVAAAASPSGKGRLRQVVESKKVEKVVSYLSSYAPTLLSFYGNVKERLPETLKSNVNVIEKDYVVPATAFTVVKCDQILTQVDEKITSTEESVYKTVEQTKETVTSTVEQTKENVTSTVEQTKEKISNTVREVLSVGLDTLENTIDYALPVAKDGDAKKENIDGDEAAEGNKSVMKRVSVLNDTLRTRLSKLALVAAIHEKKQLATTALKEKYSSTENLVKERYVVIEKAYLKPAVKYVSEQYVVLDTKYFQPVKQLVSEKYVVVDTTYLQPATKFAASNVLYPTNQFFDGLTKELNWTKGYTKYVPEATQVKEYVSHGYKTVQSKVLLPTASYLGVDETFVSYEKLILDYLSKAVDPYVTLEPTEKKGRNQKLSKIEMTVCHDSDDNAVAIEESEDWQDAPVKPNKFEPVYPSDEEE